MSLSMSWFLALLVAALSAWMIRVFVRLPPRVERTRHRRTRGGRAQPWQAVPHRARRRRLCGGHAQAARL